MENKTHFYNSHYNLSPFKKKNRTLTFSNNTTNYLPPKYLWANNEALLFMQSQSYQFLLHIDFSKISPADCALRGIKRMLIQQRSQEHLHSWVSKGRT